MKKKWVLLLPILSLALPVSCARTNTSGVEVIGRAEPVAPQRLQLPTDLPPYEEPTIQIHYYRDDAEYSKWGLWMWAEGKEGAEYEFNYQDSYGAIAYLPLSTFNNAHTIGFIVKELFSSAGSGVWKKDGESDRFLDIDMLIPDENDSYNVYLVKGSISVYTDKERTSTVKAVKTCQFNDSQNITVVGNNPLKNVTITRNGEEAAGTKTYSDDKKSVTIKLDEKAEIYDIFEATVVFDDDISCVKPVSIRNLYDKEFDDKYNYDGELGALYTPAQTIFKVWSPVSSSVELRIYENGTPEDVDATKGDDTYLAYPMTKGGKGVFEVTVPGDLEGKYYTYFAKNTSYPEGKEVVDPYAKSAGVSGLRGMIVDFSKTNPEGWNNVEYLTYDRKELTVYETHIAELTCSDTWGGTPANAKKFKGFYEAGTTYTKDGVTVKTGFDHIKELGVNAVQIIPFFDQANDETNMTFNWGYNPLNYNVIEGGYSSDPYDGYARIRELKELVKAYNEAGITIIMDVVYNHVNGLSGSNFDVLMPFYYFRYVGATGEASNGSGCGNETASDKYMFRKFMIDSTAFWTSEYKLGGYRFDLMAIHDVETMNQLTAKNKEINPNIVIYGEPWSGGTTAMPAGFTAASSANVSQFQGYGAFNDKLRDSLISGGMASDYTRAWVTQTKFVVNANAVKNTIVGSSGASGSNPDNVVSYVTCHDNFTLHDRVVAADLADYDVEAKDYVPNSEIKLMNALANSIVFTSQGTSFMLAGEEMLRSKIVYDDNGNPINAVNARGETLNIPAVSGNSYSSSYKTNEINYQLKVENLDLFKTYQKLVELKQKATGLHAKEANQVEILDEGKVIKVTFAGENNKTYVAYHRNGVGYERTDSAGVKVLSALTLGLVACSGQEQGFAVDTNGYELYMDSLGTEFVKGQMRLKPFETLILQK